MFKKILLSTILIASLYASDEKNSEDKKLLAYKNIYTNDVFGIYAAKVNMGNIYDKASYSVGLILHEDSSSKVEYGVGYKTNIDEYVDNFNFKHVQKYSEDNEGMMFFVNYPF